MKIEPADFRVLDQYMDLFRRSFSAKKLTSREYLHWLYAKNPSGPLFGVNATQNGCLISHTGCVPIDLLLKGSNCRALLALNIATDPEFQGKGLFTALGRALCERASGAGYSCIIGVSNVNALRGWTKHLGFQDVIGLSAHLGWGCFPQGDRQEVQAKATFQRVWRKETLEWRMQNPANPLSLQFDTAKDDVRMVGHTGVPGVAVQTRLFQDCPDLSPASNRSLRLSICSLTIGLEPASTSRRGLSVPLPNRLKPSPLRLIYRNLVDPTDTLDPSTILFRFIDFDAY